MRLIPALLLAVFLTSVHVAIVPSIIVAVYAYVYITRRTTLNATVLTITKER